MRFKAIRFFISRSFTLVTKVLAYLMLLLIIFFVIVAIPVYKDMEMRKNISSRIFPAFKISDDILAYYTVHEVWPNTSDMTLPAHLRIFEKGALRVELDLESQPEVFAEIKLIEHQGKYHQRCHVAGVKDGQLPAICRVRNYQYLIEPESRKIIYLD
jgi:hypothetical protein